MFNTGKGIHGIPLKRWDEVPGKVNMAGGDDPGSGYCHHSKSTFPVWHRPYVGILEV